MGRLCSKCLLAECRAVETTDLVETLYIDIFESLKAKQPFTIEMDISSGLVGDQQLCLDDAVFTLDNA